MLIAVVAGVVLGVFSKVVDEVAPAWAGNSLALWLLVAFLVGLPARGPREAAVRGAASLTVANCAYYAWRLFVIDNISVRFAVRAFSFWTALAIPAGLAAGAVARRGREGAALPAGGFGGEAAVVWIGGGRPAHLVVALSAAAILAAATRWTRWGTWVATGAAVAVGGAVALRRALL